MGLPSARPNAARCGSLGQHRPNLVHQTPRSNVEAFKNRAEHLQNLVVSVAAPDETFVKLSLLSRLQVLQLAPVTLVKNKAC